MPKPSTVITAIAVLLFVCMNHFVRFHYFFFNFVLFHFILFYFMWLNTICFRLISIDSIWFELIWFDLIWFDLIDVREDPSSNWILSNNIEFPLYINALTLAAMGNNTSPLNCFGRLFLNYIFVMIILVMIYRLVHYASYKMLHSLHTW